MSFSLRRWGLEKILEFVAISACNHFYGTTLSFLAHLRTFLFLL